MRWEKNRLLWSLGWTLNTGSMRGDQSEGSEIHSAIIGNQIWGRPLWGWPPHAIISPGLHRIQECKLASWMSQLFLLYSHWVRMQLAALKCPSDKPGLAQDCLPNFQTTGRLKPIGRFALEITVLCLYVKCLYFRAGRIWMVAPPPVQPLIVNLSLEELAPQSGQYVKRDEKHRAGHLPPTL